jgi:hypothetical protein
MSVDVSAFDRHICDVRHLLLERSNAGKVRGQGDMSAGTDSRLHTTHAERCHKRNGAHELTNSLEAHSGGGGGARSARSRVLKGACGGCGQGVFGDEARKRQDGGVYFDASCCPLPQINFNTCLEEVGTWRNLLCIKIRHLAQFIL